MKFSVRNLPVSIKSKLLLTYIIVISISMLIFTSIIYYGSKSTIKSAAQRNAEQIIASAYHNVLSLMDDINYEITSLQANKTIQEVFSNSFSNEIDEVNALENVLTGVDIYRRKISEIELYALHKDDYPSIASNGSVYSAKELQNDAWFKTMMAHNSTIRWFVYDNSSTLDNYVVASKVLIDVKSGKPVAVVKVKTVINNFTDLVKDISVADTGRVFLSTKTHIINPEQNKMISSLVNNEMIFGEMLNDRKESRYLHIDGSEHFVTSFPLDETGLYLVGAVKLREFETGGRSFFNALIITSIIMILVVLSILFYITAIITKPIFNLADSMNNFRLDDTIAIPAQSSYEIGILYKSFNTMKSTIKNLINDINLSLQLQKKSELKALQAQINPHFLYNALNSITVLAHKYDALDIEKTVDALAGFFKLSLNNGNEITTLRNELEHTRNYVSIQKIRFKDKFNLTMSVDENILDCATVKLILQPLVENCIVHAFERISYTGEIKIIGYKKEKDIYLQVEDNGLGSNITSADKLNEYINRAFAPDETIEKYGIYNINNRIKLYFGNDYGLSYIENERGGLTAIIHICERGME